MKTLAKRALCLSPSKTAAIDAMAKRLLAQGKDIANLSAGEPINPTPQSAKEAAHLSIDQNQTKYTPAAGLAELRAAISHTLKIRHKLIYDNDHIIISSGAKQAIYNTLTALIDIGDEVLIPSPYWVTYPELVKLLGGIPVIVPCSQDNNFKISIEALNTCLTSRTKAIILNSPCNPTGSVYTRRELEPIASWLEEHDIYCLSDEIYESIIYDGCSHTSIASISPGAKERTIIINGVSKAYAMTGWRIGYSASSGLLAGVIGAIQSQITLHPSNISQFAALGAIKSQAVVCEGMIEDLTNKKLLVTEYLSHIPQITFNLPQGAFYFFINITKCLAAQGANTHNIITSEDLCQFLLSEYQVALVPGSAFGAEDYIRISFTAADDVLQKGLERLSKGLISLF